MATAEHITPCMGCLTLSSVMRCMNGGKECLIVRFFEVQGFNLLCS